MKKLTLLAITAIFSFNLYCQVNWTKYPDNPVMVPGPENWEGEGITPSSVIYYDSKYHMWYSGGNFFSSVLPPHIGHATSQDGVTWTKDVNNPVLDLGPNGSWDDSRVLEPTVLISESIFHMWYSGHTGSDYRLSNYRIGHATSPDGINWTKDANNPVLDLGPDGSWDDAFVVGPSVINDGREYHMWYMAYNGISEQLRIGHATSPDGVNWTKDTLNPVLNYDIASWETTRLEYPEVIFDGTTYHMWYGGGTYGAGQIGYATSEDGSVWTKFGNNPVLRPGSTGSWDAGKVSNSTVIDSSGVKYKMWYSGGLAYETGSIGYAESPVPAWKQMEPMDIVRGKPSSTVIDTMIYVFGGCHASIGTIDSADVYNTITNEWSSLATMLEDSYGGSAEEVNGKIYLIGGWRNVGDWIVTNSTMEYDPEGDTWLEKTDSPEPIGLSTSCVMNDTIFIQGGSKSASTVDTKKAWYYVPGTDSWGSLPDMIYDRPGGHSAALLDNKIYVIGGTYGSGWNNPTGKSEVYDPQLKTWTELADMPVPVIYHISVVHDQKILVFGGDSSMTSGGSYGISIGTNFIQEYDPSTDSWRLLKNMPIKRTSMAGEKVGNFVYLIGGYLNSRDLKDPLSEVWRFDLESPNPFISVSGVSLDKDSLRLAVGSTKTLDHTVSPNVASDPSVSWTSGNPAVATVVNGTVTGVGSGEIYVYVTTTDGNFKDSCLFTVSNISQVRFGSAGDPLNGLTVTWGSGGTSDSIMWGYTSNFEEGSFAGTSRDDKFGIPVFDYTFPTLTAGSTIHYALFDSKDSKWTKEETFKTATDASNNQFSFTVLGDSRTNPDQWGIISEAVLDTDFTLYMGDIIADGAIKSDWDDWFEYGAEFIAREPVYHCIGNHDEDNSPSGFDTYLSMFTMPGNELYYSFNYGNALFICLNTEDSGNTDQYNWLLSTLEANKDQTWKIVFFHRPFYTSPSHEGEMDGYFDTWWQAFDDYGVDMIFNGHTHNYQRTKPINRNISTTSPVEYYGSNDWRGRCQVVSGAAGAPLKDAADPGLWWLDNSASIMHFCNIEINEDLLTFKAMDANLFVFDELTLDKSYIGIKDFPKTSSRIYPNPTNDLLTIETNGSGAHDIEIISPNGQLLFSKSLVGTSHQIDLSSFQKGVYFITIKSEDFVTTKKIIKL